MIVQSFKMAWKSIISNKMRSFLTMLGIIIGVFSLVVLVSLVSGATGTITDAVNSIGSNLISVTVMNDHDRPIKMEDLREYQDNELIAAVAPNIQSSAMASTRLDEKSVSVIGTTSSYTNIQNIKLLNGRFLALPDEENHTLVTVINYDMAIDLLGRTDVVGEKVKLNGLSYEVVGVLEKEESSMASMMGSTYTCYIPYASLIRMSSNVGTSITSFYLSATDENLDAAEKFITDEMKHRFSDDEDAYMIFNQSTIANVMGEITGVLSLLLGGIAAISLLVGGIGIMNIMLVSVTERTREIGIRKAIGAGQGTILLQFLIEAMMVSMIGCVIGLFTSWIGLMVINRIGNVSYGVNPTVAIISVIFSMGIGVLFGIYPARKAARKKPIDALRYS